MSARRDRTSQRYRSIFTLGGALLAGTLGCAEIEEESQAAVEETESLGEAEAEIDGRIRYDATMRPFKAAYMERSMQYARTVVSTPAFEQCVRQTLNARYINCRDPNQADSRATQIEKAIAIIKHADNAIAFTSTTATGDAQATYQGHNTGTEHTIQIGPQNDADFGDWDTLYGVAPGTADDFMPWNFRAGTMTHEFMHTHDYGHLDPWCALTDDPATPPVHGCANPGCAWTSQCGGTGIPPASITSYETAGVAQQEYCAYLEEGDDAAYYADGEPSIPYIIGECAGRMVEESHEACGKATASSCSDWSAMRLLTSWTGTAEDEQLDSAACGCYDDPRKTVALRTNTGQHLTALNGGGSTVRTDWPNLVGAWQFFYLIDRNGGQLLSGDSIGLKTHTGHWLQTDYSASLLAHKSHTIYRDSGTGPIGDGTTINLGNLWLNPSTWMNEWRYAHAGATSLGFSSGFGSPQNDLVVERPRRDTLIVLRSTGGYYARVNSTGSPMLAWTNRTTNQVLDGTVAEQAEAAFWLIDHSGGNLVNGDTVSLETFVNDAYAYLTVSGAGTGQLRVASGISAPSKFVVTKVTAGDAVVRHNDTITLTSSTGNLLSGATPTSGGQLTNSGVAGAVTAAQRFTLRHVSQHDKARPTW